MQAHNIVPIKKSKVILIHEKAILLAGDLRSKYLELFEILIEVELEQIYLQFDIPSFYTYCTELLELSPQISKDFSVVIKKSQAVPALAKAIREKRITISKARKICSVLTELDAKKWIELAETCTTRIIEKAVAQANPKEAVVETLTYASESRLELKLGVSEEWAKLLSQTKDLLSQKNSRAVSTEEALLIVMNDFNERHHPLRKAERTIARAQRNVVSTDKPQAQHQKQLRQKECDQKPKEMTPKRVGKREPLKRSVIHFVNVRDQNQCTHISRSGRCEQKRWLDLHHITPLARGGDDSIENLTTLCHAHHKMQHLNYSVSVSDT